MKSNNNSEPPKPISIHIPSQVEPKTEPRRTPPPKTNNPKEWKCTFPKLNEKLTLSKNKNSTNKNLSDATTAERRRETHPHFFIWWWGRWQRREMALAAAVNECMWRWLEQPASQPASLDFKLRLRICDAVCMCESMHVSMYVDFVAYFSGKGEVAISTVYCIFKESKRNLINNISNKL